MRNLISTTLLGSAFAVLATVVSAATVTMSDKAFAPGAYVTPDDTTGTVFKQVTGSVGGVRADPWAATAFAGKGEYTSVSGDSSATFNVSLRKSINLLWGTPDSYNFIDLLADGKIVDSVGGAMTGIANFADQTTNRFVRVSSLFNFDQVVYRSVTSNAFEFATVAPVPVPAAGLLLLGGLGGLAALRRRRNA